MATLNHVSIWTEHGWKHITAEEASRKYLRTTVPANSGIFMCELCGQYVTFTVDNYFMHSRGYSDKSCDERTHYDGYSYSSQAWEYNLPMRLLSNEDRFHLEVGFPPVPPTMLKANQNNTISIKAVGHEPRVYCVDRLYEDSICYLEIDGVSSDRYLLEYPSSFSKYWPDQVEGINPVGTLFSCNTKSQSGKRIPAMSDVMAGKTYFLLTTTVFSNCSGQSDGVTKKMVASKLDDRKMWRLYVIEVPKLTKEAALFFWNNGHYRLTDQPVKITPIWPLYIQTPNIIKYNKERMIIHLSGSHHFISKVLSYPFTETMLPLYDLQNKQGKMLILSNIGRQQLIAIGSNNAQYYWYFWKESLPAFVDTEAVSVTDRNGNVLSGGEQSILPRDGIIRIMAPYDGLLIRLKGNTIIEKLQIKANTQISIQEIVFGSRLQVLQGLDVAWEVFFVKPSKRRKSELATDADAIIFRKLCSLKGKMIPIPHSLGAVSRKLGQYPLTQKWLYDAIHKGFAPEKAIKYLKRVLLEL